MEESIKNRLILALTISTLIFFIFSVSSCFNSSKQKVDRDREIVLRMELEEKLNGIVTEKAELESKVKELTQSTEERKKALTELQGQNKMLKDEMEKITKLKEALEEDLKEALVRQRK